MRILSADFGTSSVKMAIADDNQNILTSTKVYYDYQVLNKMHVQLDADVVYQAFLEGCHHFGQQIKEIDTLVFCVFSPCLIAMDVDGTPLCPAILHLDRRSYAQSRYAVRRLGKEPFLRINGNLPFAGGISCTSMLWIKDNCPDIYKKTHKFGHLNTYFLKKMVDEWIIDPTNASFTGIYETLSFGGWSKELCNGLGLSMDKLPEIRPSLSLAGSLCSDVATASGLRSGIPVLVGANDTSAAAFGAGAVKNGDINNISGSSEIATITTTQPVTHEKYYIRTSVEENTWLYLAITVGGFALDWFRKQFYPDMGKTYFYEDYLQSVIEKNIVPEVRFLPHLSGDRHSLQKRRGAFYNLTLDTTREEMLVALLIGSFDPILNMLRLVEKHQPLNSDITWTGGLISDSYQQFKNKVFKGYTFHTRQECSTMGNLKIAGHVLKV